MIWIDEAQLMLEAIKKTQAEAIESASRIAANSIGSGGVMYASGTGHSRMAVEELFPRYGSFPGFYPLVELSTTFHTEVVGTNGQRQAMFIEKVEGLAAAILASFDLHQPDSFILFSASGQNAVTIEMAMIARDAGLPVVGVTSLAESQAGPARHSSGKRLFEVCDVVIDMCAPVGDALSRVDGLDTPVGPGTSLSSVAIVNSIKVRTAELLVEQGAMPPVLTSRLLVGEERSSQLFEDAYLDFAERSKTLLRTRGTK
jgi:uncharacterized phosphosugar-binding protein